MLYRPASTTDTQASKEVRIWSNMVPTGATRNLSNLELDYVYWSSVQFDICQVNGSQTERVRESN